MTLPKVYAYLDYRAFLTAWLDAKKQVVKGYSYAAFAKEGGCSKAALANVIGGTRTPRAGTLDAFAQAMKLTPQERSYLGLLVDLANAPGLEQRREVMDRILSRERYQQVRVADNDESDALVRLLENWWTPAIREMAGLEGFRNDANWVAHTLNPPIRVDQAAAALETLFSLGLLVEQEDGTVLQPELRFRTEPETAEAAVIRYHRDVLPELLGRIESCNHSIQHLVAATVTLDASLIPEAKARLNAVFDQLVALSDEGSELEGRRVYQVAVQLLPMSRSES